MNAIEALRKIVEEVKLPIKDGIIATLARVDKIAREALSTPPSDAGGTEIRDLLEQCKRDLAAAHAEICKLQDIDPAKHTWPQWSSVAHTLAWIDRVLAAAPVAPTEGERG